MTLLLSYQKIISSSTSKMFRTCVRNLAKITMGDPIEHATGIEKRELLAIKAGNDDPFGMKVVKRGPGTKDNPNEIPSAFESRIVGCICDPNAPCISYMWLHKGHPKRCQCGYWFVLVHNAPL